MANEQSEVVRRPLNAEELAQAIHSGDRDPAAPDRPVTLWANLDERGRQMRREQATAILEQFDVFPKGAPVGRSAVQESAPPEKPEPVEPPTDPGV